MRFKRSGGVLLHPTSLPGPYGIGGLGASAFRFIDFLQQSSQTVWQVLPLGPTGYGDSPYQSFSSFAGNHLLIDPDLLVRDGFLKSGDLEPIPSFPEKRVDYRAVIAFKSRILERFFNRFTYRGSSGQRAAFKSFCEEHKDWLEDFALFMALKNHHLEHEGGIWNTWPSELVSREPEALESRRRQLSDDVREQKFRQFLFYSQWLALKEYANKKKITILGDIPIFVAYDSADVWVHQELFLLDKKENPRFVAGVPPDYFSKTGQRWGNPLYNWPRLKGTGYAWWLDRIQITLKLVDIVRLDHFRGLESYWQIPAREETAIKGKWLKAPGGHFLKTVREKLGSLPFIAEDLGVITPEVERLRDEFDFPGMKVLQFAFNRRADNSFLPHNYSSNCVVYTGTHDNDTTLGWYASESEKVRDRVRRYLARDGHDIAWDLVRLAYSSVADMAIAPLQDLMKLGTEARMNFPGKTHGNWQWRYSDSMLTDEISGRLRELTKLYDRCPESET